MITARNQRFGRTAGAFVSALAAAAALLAACSPAANAQVTEPNSSGGTGVAPALPEGTPVFVTLKQRLRSGAAKPGQTVAFTVTSDVRRGGAVAGPNAEVLILAGTPAVGTVVESRGAGAFGKPGRLRVSCDYVLLPDRTRVSLRAIDPDNSKAVAAESASSNGGKGAAITLHASGRSRRGPATATMLVVGLPVYAYTYLLANLFGTNENAFQGQVVPAIVGVGSSLIVGSLWRGGNVTLPEGKTFAVEVAAASATGTLPAPVASP